MTNNVNDENKLIEEYRQELLSFHSGNRYSVAKDSTQIRTANYRELVRLREAMLKIKSISEESKSFTTSRTSFK